MRQSYETLTAAIRARQWVREFGRRHGRVPTTEERSKWIAFTFPAKIDEAYVSRACDNAHAVPFNPNREV